MFDRVFTKIYDLAGKYRVLILVLLLIFAAGSLIRLSSISLKSNIDLMFPTGSTITRDIRFLQESDFTGKVLISLKLNDPGFSQKKLIAAADKLSELLCPGKPDSDSISCPSNFKLDSLKAEDKNTYFKKPLYISEVVNGLSKIDYMVETRKLMNYAPQLITGQELEAAKQKITPEGVKSALKNIYNKLVLSPGSSFFSSFASSDPLDIKTPLLTSLQRLNGALEYKVKIVDEHFISYDGQHLLLILSTPVEITDMKGGVKLLDYLNSKLKQLPEYVSWSIVCGHLHSISNEQVMKKDIVVIMSIASLLFFLLFIFMFKSIRAILVFILPFLGIIISSGICSLFINNLALFVLGMGGVLAGIAIDYGIHVYIAVRVGGNKSGNIQKIYKPIMIGALTTIGILASFFFSRVEGYHQLAFFSVISLFICVFCSIFLLPHFFTKDKTIELVDNRQNKTDKYRIYKCASSTSRILLILWAIFIIISIFYAIRLAFNSDIAQFDGSEPEIFGAEKQFHKIWGQQNQTAILVAQGNTLDQALKLNEQFYAGAIAKIGKDRISSIAPLWPPGVTRMENARRWLSFWKGGEEAKLKKLIKKYSPEFGFSKGAFAPFFKSLYKGTDVKNIQPVFLKDVMKRFIIQKDNFYQVLSFFPDTEHNVTAMNKVCSSFTDAFVVSRKSMSRQLSQAISSEILYMSFIALVVIPLLTMLFLRNIAMALIALVPVFSGLLGILGLFSVLGMSFNAASVISSVVILGLCIDYGIFMVYSCRSNRKTGTVAAVILSALTTLMGAGGLLFAKHPMLYYVGFTVSVGIFWGVITALFVVPALYKLVYRE